MRKRIQLSYSNKIHRSFKYLLANTTNRSEKARVKLFGLFNDYMSTSSERYLPMPGAGEKLSIPGNVTYLLISQCRKGFLACRKQWSALLHQATMLFPTLLKVFLEVPSTI